MLPAASIASRAAPPEMDRDNYCRRNEPARHSTKFSSNFANVFLLSFSILIRRSSLYSLRHASLYSRVPDSVSLGTFHGFGARTVFPRKRNALSTAINREDNCDNNWRCDRVGSGSSIICITLCKLFASAIR